MKGFKLLFTVSIFLTLFSCYETKNEALKDQLVGAWTVYEIENEFSDSAQTIRNPQPGIWIFSDGYYSATFIPGTKIRIPYEHTFNPTPVEMINAYNSIVVNTGTYELTDTTLITFPVVSRVPDFSGGKGIYELRIESDTLYLTMTEEYSRNGDWANWLDNLSRTIKLVKSTK